MGPRPTFVFPSYAPSYFLGHMARSLRDLPKVLTDIDLVIEARDARLPLSGINGNFERVIQRSWGGMGAGVGGSGGAGWGRNRLVAALTGQPMEEQRNPASTGEGRVRERIVVYTKRDLAEPRYEEPLRKAFLDHAGQRVFFANTNSDKHVGQILRYAVQLAEANRAVMDEMKVLVVGMPNVGKSSLLNALRRVGVRKGKAFRISSQPGYTRKLTGTVKISSDPNVYVYDTPGVMVPYMGKGEYGAERALKFALTTGIKEGLFEEELVAEYALYLLNLHHYLSGTPDVVPTYQTALGIPPSSYDTLSVLLDALAKRLGTLRKGGEGDTDAALVYFLKAFREGKLGRITLDNMRQVGAGEVGEAETEDQPAGRSGILASLSAAMAKDDFSPSAFDPTPAGRLFFSEPSGSTMPPSMESVSPPSCLEPEASSSSSQGDSPGEPLSPQPASDTNPQSTPSPDGDLSSIPSTPDDDPSMPSTPSTRRDLNAEVSAAVRTYLAEQSRKLDQTEEMSLSQERKKENQLKKKEKEDKWKAKHPGLAAGVAGQAGGRGVGWSRGDMRMKAKKRR